MNTLEKQIIDTYRADLARVLYSRAHGTPAKQMTACMIAKQHGVTTREAAAIIKKHLIDNIGTDNDND